MAPLAFRRGRTSSRPVKGLEVLETTLVETTLVETGDPYPAKFQTSERLRRSFDFTQFQKHPGCLRDLTLIQRNFNKVGRRGEIPEALDRRVASLVWAQGGWWTCMRLDPGTKSTKPSAPSSGQGISGYCPSGDAFACGTQPCLDGEHR